MRRALILFACSALALRPTEAAAQADFEPLDAALSALSLQGGFSGAVVIRDADGVRFAKGYGQADPFSRRAFRIDTPVDSASLAKPVTAAAVLLLVQEGVIALDAPVASYLTEFPYPEVTVRQLLAHSAGLPSYESLEPLAGKTNSDMLLEMKRNGLPLAFRPGSAFEYCNTCYNTLGLLIERVTGVSYIDFAHDRLKLPAQAGIRPRALAEWADRAVGYRYTADGAVERSDSYEGEAFYGSANLSISAEALAQWGAEWATNSSPVRNAATSPVQIDTGVSGLTLGSWYCAQEGSRCHYLGQHEGFHHMLYWDAERRLSIAMVTNSSLSPELQQRVQRMIVEVTNGDTAAPQRELGKPLERGQAAAGIYRTGEGEIVTLGQGRGSIQRLTRSGVTYDVFPAGTGVAYAPGLDCYVSSSAEGNLRLLSLYEDITARLVK